MEVSFSKEIKQLALGGEALPLTPEQFGAIIKERNITGD